MAWLIRTCHDCHDEVSAVQMKTWAKDETDNPVLRVELPVVLCMGCWRTKNKPAKRWKATTPVGPEGVTASTPKRKARRK
jgi:hypothetical protein